MTVKTKLKIAKRIAHDKQNFINSYIYESI